MRSTLSLARIAGIRVRVHLSWLPLYALVTWSVATSVLPYRPVIAFALAAVYGIVLFASLIAHEFAHALVAVRFGVRTRAITLFLFGGVATLETEPPTPRAEIAIALAGPIASVALALAFYALSVACEAIPAARWTPAAADLTLLLAMSNAVIAGFNLIPAFPMDGGRVLRAVVWHVRKSRAQATATASLCGLALGVSFGVFALTMFATTREWQFAWYLVMSGFVMRMTWSGYADACVARRIERLALAA